MSEAAVIDNCAYQRLHLCPTRCSSLLRRVQARGLPAMGTSGGRDPCVPLSLRPLPQIPSLAVSSARARACDKPPTHITSGGAAGGTGVGGIGNRYVRVEFGGTKARTKTKWKTRAPKWGESFLFPHPDFGQKKASLEVSHPRSWVALDALRLSGQLDSSGASAVLRLLRGAVSRGRSVDRASKALSP